MAHRPRIALVLPLAFVVVAATVVILLHGPAAAQDGDGQAGEVERVLRETRLSPDFEDAPIDLVAGWLRDGLGVPVLIHPDLADDDPDISLRLSDVRAETILKLLGLNGVGTRIRGGSLLLVRRGHSDARLETHMEDVTDLLARIPDNRAPATDTGGERIRHIGIGPEDEGRMGLWEEELVDLIEDSMSENSWPDDARVSIREPGVLVVHHRPDMVAHVRELLSSLRAHLAGRVRLRVDLIEGPADRITDAPGPITAERAEELRALAASGGARRLLSGALTLRNGVLGHLADQRARRYVGDYDVEVAEQSANTDPVIHEITDLEAVEVRPIASADGSHIRLELRVLREHLDDMEELEVAGGLLQLPHTHGNTTAATVIVSTDAGGSALLPVGPGAAAGTQIALVITAGVADRRRAEAPDIALRPAAALDRDEALAERLATETLDADLRGVGLNQALATMRLALGMNVHVDPTLDEDRGEFTVRAQAITARNYLDLLAESFDVTWQPVEGVILVTDASGGALPGVLRLYDVRDFLSPPEPHPLPRIFRTQEPDPNTGAEFFGSDEAPPAISPDDLVDMIVETVHPHSWDMRDDAFITVAGGLLVVRNAEWVQGDVAALVDRTRRFQTEQIVLDARWLDAPGEVLEDLLATDGTVLTDAEAERLLEASQERARLGTVSLQHQPVGAAAWVRRDIIDDWDLEVAKNASAHDPLIARAVGSHWLDATAGRADDRLMLTLRTGRLAVEDVRRVDLAAGPLHLPEIRETSGRVEVQLAGDAWILVILRGAGAGSRGQCVLVRVSAGAGR